ncbi:WXG100 family type VII secretion target [Kitasatospora sp. NPDC059747]|uniref:WXG100 family type VII secretion target n=1 Tax=Kitasatospora sp. NPDC059747 TaxID=3346930 RepID=UPI0036685911
MAYTDFGTYSHTQLRAMVHALNPGEVMAAGDPWRRAADTLKAIRTTLTRASTEAATTWEGTTSDAFHTRMLHLAERINHAAAYANDAANTLHHVADAIAKAKRDMPEEPGNWAQFKDAVTTFTDDDPTPLAARKKAEAATVMQTLAMHYRTATPMLKAPQGLPGLGKLEEARDVTPQDQSVAAAVVLPGTAVGASRTSERPASSSAPRRPGRVERSAAGATAPKVASVPTGLGIEGSAVPGPVGPVSVGPSTGLDGASVPNPGRFGSVAAAAVAQPPPSAGPTPLGASNSRQLGSGWVAGISGVVRSGESTGRGGRGAGGGVVGGIAQPGSRSRGKQAFTEGGSGLGTRGRMSGVAGPAATGGVAPGVPLGGGRRGRKDGERAGKRPDYLIEDPETWEADKRVNPNVVE